MLTCKDQKETPSPGLWYALFTLAVAAVALAGYAGYHYYPRFNLPAVEGMGLLALATGAGIASFFSPCSFPLLLTLLGRETNQDKGHHPLVFASFFSVGAFLFLMLTGIIIGLAGRALFATVTFTSPAGITLRLGVGLLLLYLGLVQLNLAPSPFQMVEHWVRPLVKKQAQWRRGKKKLLSYTAFGFGYLLAGFG